MKHATKFARPLLKLGTEQCRLFLPNVFTIFLREVYTTPHIGAAKAMLDFGWQFVPERSPVRVQTDPQSITAQFVAGLGFALLERSLACTGIKLEFKASDDKKADGTW